MRHSDWREDTLQRCKSIKALLKQGSMAEGSSGQRPHLGAPPEPGGVSATYNQWADELPPIQA